MMVENDLHNLLFLIVLFAAPLLALVIWAARRDEAYSQVGRRWIYILFFFSLIAHPLVQLLLLDDIDMDRGGQLVAKAKEVYLIGMTVQQVESEFGEPTFISGDQRIESGFNGTWNYKQLPGFWFGRKFQVFFKDGAVTGFEPNDD